MIAVPNEPLAPSSRDFEVYRAVALDRMSTRAVASEIQVSQTRVRQIIAKVEDFTALHMPLLDKATKERRIGVAQFIGSLRMNHCYSLAMACFKASENRKIVTVREQGRERVITTRTSLADMQIMNAVMRYALAATKLPHASLDDLELLSLNEREKLGAALADKSVHEVEHHPDGDCSLAVTEDAQNDTADDAVSHLDSEACLRETPPVRRLHAAATLAIKISEACLRETPPVRGLANRPHGTAQFNGKPVGDLSPSERKAFQRREKKAKKWLERKLQQTRKEERCQT